MAKTTLLDEIHVTTRIADDVPKEQVRAIRDALLGPAFMTRLRRAVRTTVRAFPELTTIRVSLGR